MKTLKLILSVISLIVVIPQSHASIDLGGTWSYSLNAKRTYFSNPPAQSGSYTGLGSGYYRYGYLDGGRITNNNASGVSGSLALEFWSTNYYGGTQGFRMFTRGFSPLAAGYYYPNIYKTGYFKSPGHYGYGKLYVKAYNNGWYVKDSVAFNVYKYH